MQDYNIYWGRRLFLEGRLIYEGALKNSPSPAAGGAEAPPEATPQKQHSEWVQQRQREGAKLQRNISKLRGAVDSKNRNELLIECQDAWTKFIQVENSANQAEIKSHHNAMTVLNGKVEQYLANPTRADQTPKEVPTKEVDSKQDEKTNSRELNAEQKNIKKDLIAFVENGMEKGINSIGKGPHALVNQNVRTKIFNEIQKLYPTDPNEQVLLEGTVLTKEFTVTGAYSFKKNVKCTVSFYAGKFEVSVEDLPKDGKVNNEGIKEEKGPDTLRAPESKQVLLNRAGAKLRDAVNHLKGSRGGATNNIQGDWNRILSDYMNDFYQRLTPEEKNSLQRSIIAYRDHNIMERYRYEVHFPVKGGVSVFRVDELTSKENTKPEAGLTINNVSEKDRQKQFIEKRDKFLGLVNASIQALDKVEKTDDNKLNDALKKYKQGLEINYYNLTKVENEAELRNIIKDINKLINDNKGIKERYENRNTPKSNIPAAKQGSAKSAPAIATAAKKEESKETTSTDKKTPEKGKEVIEIDRAKIEQEILENMSSAIRAVEGAQDYDPKNVLKNRQILVANLQNNCPTYASVLNQSVKKFDSFSVKQSGVTINIYGRKNPDDENVTVMSNLNYSRTGFMQKEAKKSLEINNKTDLVNAIKSIGKSVKVGREYTKRLEAQLNGTLSGKIPTNIPPGVIAQFKIPGTRNTCNVNLTPQRRLSVFSME